MSEAVCSECGENVVDEVDGFDEHSRNVEGTFEYVALGGLGDCSVAVEIAEPFRIFVVGQVGIHPVVGLAVEFDVMFVAGGEVAVESGDDGPLSFV